MESGEILISLKPSNVKTPANYTYGHIAIEVASAAEACDRVRSKGRVVVKEPASLRPGSRPIAFVKDLVGYFI